MTAQRLSTGSDPDTLLDRHLVHSQTWPLTCREIRDPPFPQLLRRLL